MNYSYPARVARRFARLASLPVVTLLIALTDPDASAADSTRFGTIEGRVLNARNGTYVTKARVTVEGTTLEDFTNDYGEYHLIDVPVGPRHLTVTYTGQPPVSGMVNVVAGATAKHDFEIGESPDGTVKMGEFVVSSERYKNAADLAINEERYSVNIKNVVAADAFGDIPSGNVGEFIKFLPGVELEYGGTYIAPTDAFGISVRGFGSADTAIYIDGVPVAAAPQASLTTQVGLDMLSINNASRVELIKVPTPDMPMNSVGGQINLISKSAFEYAKPQLLLEAYVTMNSDYPNPFEKVAGPTSKKVYAGNPGFSISYIRPVNKKFGFTVTGSMYSQYSANRRYRPEFVTANATADLRPFGGANNTSLTNTVGPASIVNPFMTRISVTDSPHTNISNSLSLKGDYRPLTGLTLTGMYQLSTYKARDAARRLQFRIQRPQTWDANSTISLPYLTASQSRTGSAFNPSNSLDMNIDSRDKEGITHTAYAKAVYQRGPWDIFALASLSTSRGSFKDFQNGHFSTVDVSAGGSIGQMKFEDIRDGRAHNLTVLDRNGAPFDWTNLGLWAPTIKGRSGKAESMDDSISYKLDVQRELDFLPWRDAVPLSFKTGWLRQEDLEKKWGVGTNYQMSYIGPSLGVNDYLDTTYAGISPGWGMPGQQWISTYKLYDIYKANPNNFSVTEADAVQNWNSLVGQNKRIRDRKDAYYAMISGRALKNRLNFVIGARQENSRRDGAGPMGDGSWQYIKNSDGTVYRNIALLGGTGSVRFDQAASPLFANTTTGNALRADLTSKNIAFPTSVISSTSLAGTMLQRRLLVPVHGKSDGRPSPSIDVAYNITENLIGRVSWSRTFGKIPLEDTTKGLLSGNTNDFKVTQADDPTAIPAGTISVANPNLLPEISNNWDFSLTYYTHNGGKLEGSYYMKKISNFSQTYITTSADPEFSTVLNSLGLDPADYQDWQLTTSVNGIGAGKVSGFELQAAQDLRFVPGLSTWGQHVYIFATYSRSHRSESNTNRISARPAANQLFTAGVNVSVQRFSVSVKGTWRDTFYVQTGTNATYNGVVYEIGQYTPSQTKVDLNATYQLTKRYSLFLTARDVFNTGLRSERHDSAGLYPAYAQWDDLREFGVNFTVGVKALF